MTVSPAAEKAWNEYVSEVRERLVEHAYAFISKDTKLVHENRGAWKGMSPFRKERSPSFYLYADGGWHDFGTQESGDLIGYVRKRDNVTFREAVDKLAEHVGLPTWEARKKTSPQIHQLTEEQLLELWESNEDKQRVFEVMTALVHLCHECLPTRVATHLRNHYGLPSWFIAFEKIGWVPDGLWGLAKEQTKYSDDDLLASGFFVPIDGHEPAAAMSQRILFPYWKDGLCVYTIGREFYVDIPREQVNIAPYDQGKYKKHLTWDRDRRPYVSSWIANDTFWGEDSVRGCRGEPVLITEGITDAYMLRILGYRVISPVTVSFRTKDAEHAVALLRGASETVILNDADVLPDGRQPGLEGAKRMALELHAAKLPVRIGKLPRPEGVSKTDVNELGQIALFGENVELAEEEWKEAEARLFFDGILAKATTIIQFLIEELPADAPVEELQKAIDHVGALACDMTELLRLALFDELHARFPKLPKGPAKRAFLRASEAAAKEKKKEAIVEAVKEQTESSKAAPAIRGRMRGAVAEDIGSYDRIFVNGDRERISSFGLTLRRVIRPLHETQEHLVCEVTGVQGDALHPGSIIPPRAWNSKRSFLSHFPTTRMQWSGSDDEVQGVLETLSKDRYTNVPIVQSVNAIGRYDLPAGPRFVLPAGTMGPEGWMESPDLIYLPEGTSNLQNRLDPDPTPLNEGRDLLKSIWADLWSIQEEVPITTMLAWCVANYAQPFLRARLRGFPILNIAATQGSGKSSLFSAVLWPLFVGVTQGEPLSCTSSLFSYTKDFSSTNALFLPLDEYKPSDMKEQSTDVLHRLLRRVYAGEAETRGRADQTVAIYYLRAGCALLGEMKLDHDPALAERTIYVPLSKMWLEKMPSGRKAFQRLLGHPLAKIAPFLQCWSLSLPFDEMLTKATSTTLEVLGETTVSERVRANLITIAFGTLMLRSLADTLDVPLMIPPLRTVFQRALEQIYDVDADPSADANEMPKGHVTDAIDTLLVEASAAAQLGVLEENVHYAMTDGGIALWLSGILATLAEHRQRRHDRPLPLNERALCRIAREKQQSGCPYLVSVSARCAILPGGDRLRCIVVDPTKIPAQLGVNPFRFRQRGHTPDSGVISWADAANKYRVS